MCDRPDKVYKYLNARRVQDVLTNLKIRFSQVSSLNDATEFTPPTLGVGEREAILKAIRGRLEQKFPGLIAIYRNLYPDHVVEEILQGLAEKGASEVEENFEKTRDRIYQQLDRNFGVLSLSGSPVERLMWAHYGDGERGYLIEFDARHPWFSQERGPGDGFRHLRPVKYVATRDPKYIFDLDDEAVLYTKNSEYAWEHEWRMILNFNEAAAKLGVDAYGIDVLLFSVPPQCITGVVIGPRADPAVMATLKTLVHGNPDLAHVVFKKTVRINDEITLLPDDDIAAH
jgi:hypothetical protein